MREKVHTFGKLHLEVDKMAGLRLSPRIEGNTQCLWVQGWDQTHVPTVNGELILNEENTIWRGTLLTADQIRNVFEPHPDGIAKTYARRSGRLGRPKTVGVVRLETIDAVNFQLVLCNGGEEPISTLATVVDQIDNLNLIASINEESLRVLMFDRAVYRKKLEKIIS